MQQLQQKLTRKNLNNFKLVKFLLRLFIKLLLSFFNFY